MMAAKRASSSANDVSIRHATSGWRALISRHTSTPEPSGSRTSSTATSGRLMGMRMSASAAVPASSTTWMSPSASTSERSPWRTTSWSSRRKSRIFSDGATAPGLGPRRQDARLNRFLDAVLAVAADLSLPVVLHRIVESAAELVDARYGALGVLGPDRTLVEFITVGFTPQTVEAIGELPHGHGILGLLIVEPEPLRLRDLNK